MLQNLVWILDIDGTPIDFGPPYAQDDVGDDNASDEQEPARPTAAAGNITATPQTP
ncbi:hypothetical protein WMC41_09885 [Shinella yambaruensis]|uniref:hypothetical protein n=1 Tax=Shinella yambaruensis TaxID=415996 RepID=UPI003D7AE1C8